MITRAVLLAVSAVMIAGPAFGDAQCNYNGAIFSHGSAVCQSGSQYRCDDGEWIGLAVACTESPANGPKGCAFNGSTYSAGEASCQANTQYRCDDGAWVRLGVACTTSGQMAARVPAAGSTCTYNGATLGTDSTICKAGVTFRCERGDWRNLGTACQ